MQVNTANLPSVAQLLGPTTRAATSRADGGSVTRHVAAPVTDSAAQSVESLHSIRFAAQYDRPTGRVVTRVIDATNGEVVHQIPHDDELRLLAGIREMIGIVVDESA